MRTSVNQWKSSSDKAKNRNPETITFFEREENDYIKINGNSAKPETDWIVQYNLLKTWLKEIFNSLLNNGDRITMKDEKDYMQLFR